VSVEVIKKGLENIGIYKCWDTTFQDEAMLHESTVFTVITSSHDVPASYYSTANNPTTDEVKDGACSESMDCKCKSCSSLSQQVINNAQDPTTNKRPNDNDDGEVLSKKMKLQDETPADIDAIKQIELIGQVITTPSIEQPSVRIENARPKYVVRDPDSVLRPPKATVKRSKRQMYRF